MQAFGLIGLLVAVALGVWVFFGTSGTVEAPENGSESADDASIYENSIDAAKEAAELLEGSVPVATGELIEVYDGVRIPKNARELDLSERGLSGSLKAEIRHLENLEILDISDNNFTGIPAEVGQLLELRVLNLSGNPLTGLPYELGNLSNLQTLDLQNTNYSQADLEIIKQQLPPDTIISVD